MEIALAIASSGLAPWNLHQQAARKKLENRTLGAGWRGAAFPDLAERILIPPPFKRLPRAHPNDYFGAPHLTH